MKDEWSEWGERHRRQSCEGSSERVRATSEFQTEATRGHVRRRSFCSRWASCARSMSRLPILPAVLLLIACATQPHEVRRNFDGTNISRVILRASAAADAGEVNLPPSSPAVRILGVSCVRVGERAEPLYLSPDASSSRPRPDFVARQFGDTLVISTTNEIRYSDRDYYMDPIHLWISLPTNIHVIRQVRRLSSDGSPDLSPP